MKKKLTTEQMEELRMVYILSNEFSKEFKELHFTNVLKESYIKTKISMRELARDYSISKSTVCRVIGEYMSSLKRKTNGY